MSLTPEQRTLRARLAAYSKWAQTSDRSAATAAARAGQEGRWERQVDPQGLLDPQERARLAESAKKAYFVQLAYKSSRARSRAKDLVAEAEAAEAELAVEAV